MVAPEHGNFIVNLGGATADDVVRLLTLIREGVAAPLELEWELWGFGDTRARTEVSCSALFC